MRRLIATLALLLTALGVVAAPPAGPPRLVLIIDDLGDNYPLGARAIELPGDITYSVLPETPDASRLAIMAHRAGKQVMLHVPMSNVGHLPLGPGGLTDDMHSWDLMAWLHYDIDSVPYVRGVNNHMGSELTADPQAMATVMRELQCHDLYFIDSRTTTATVAARAAAKAGIAHLSRDVFLDDSRQRGAMRKQFRHWLALARRDGFAVAIAHPHPATLEFLERNLPRAVDNGYQLVFPSAVLKQPTLVDYHRIARAHARGETVE